MTKASPRERRELEAMLAGLGLERGTHRALMLLPLVYVAWADGKMAHAQVEQIRRFARSALHLTPATVQVVSRWLEAAPSEEYVERGLSGLLGLALDEESLSVDVAELPELLLHAEAIATATADALDAPDCITPSEERALREIARLLNVDSGDTWKKVLTDLRARHESAGAIAVAAPDVSNEASVPPAGNESVPPEATTEPPAAEAVEATDASSPPPRQVAVQVDGTEA